MKKKEIPLIIEELTQGCVTVMDVNGIIVAGKAETTSTSSAYPIQLEKDTIGWVLGSEKAAGIAKLISYLAAQEWEKRALGRETLEKYKELTVIYDITEKLAASLDIKQVCQLVIEEAQRLIKADHIFVIMLDEEAGKCKIHAAAGMKYDSELVFEPGQGIIGSVLASGKAEIVNDVISDPRYIRRAIKFSSIMCAPLRIKDRVIGVINVSSIFPVIYTAEDLKILSALALQAAVAAENARLYDSLKETFLTTVYTLAETIEKRDPYTGGHTKRVMAYSIAIGETLGLTDEEMERLRLAAILHDVGKIGIGDDVLLKQGRLTDEEFSQIKMHTVYGQQVLHHIRHFKDIIPGVMYHHERYDGKGYPEKLLGEDIDITARIIAVADTYDAMTTDRPYRKGLSHEVAVEELKRCSGTQFDPKLVEAFLGVDIAKIKERL